MCEQRNSPQLARSTSHVPLPLQSYWPFHKAACRPNQFADAVEQQEPKFAAWMRAHGKLAVLQVGWWSGWCYGRCICGWLLKETATGDRSGCRVVLAAAVALADSLL